MQAYPASAHLLYHTPYHHFLPGPQDHELKKQYLALLPPEQIIDICLNFEIHVPPYIKSTIWPSDFNAAIAALKKPTGPAVETIPGKPPSNSNRSDASPSADSPEKPPATSSDAAIPSAEGRPPGKDPPQPVPSSEQAKTQQPIQSSPPQATQPPAYPHQPYGYPHTYPHAPYYSHAATYPAYPGYPPYFQVPGYPTSTPQPYPQPTQQLPQPATNIQVPPPHLQHSQDHFGAQSPDDLPSYEDMIAEALLDSSDPDGCAPKDVFTWMATRYPLQSNFRPSASQALQKAFKRGRFLKTPNGKYKINTTWEGGPTSRRTTRRPQTLNQAIVSNAGLGSLFTHAPLVHQPKISGPTNLPQQQQNFPFGILHGQNSANFPSPGGQAQALPYAVGQSKTTTANPEEIGQNDRNVEDPYEAAQNILKAINFGSLLRLPPDEDSTAGGSAPGVSSSVLVPDREQTEHSARAELQAHLVLLAAQLADFVQDDPPEAIPTQSSASVVQLLPSPGDSSSLAHATPPVMDSLPPPRSETRPIGSTTPSGAPLEEDDSEDDDMEEII